jgi:hypothetical protein
MAIYSIVNIADAAERKIPSMAYSVPLTLTYDGKEVDSVWRYQVPFFPIFSKWDDFCKSTDPEDQIVIQVHDAIRDGNVEKFQSILEQSSLTQIEPINYLLSAHQRLFGKACRFNVIGKIPLIDGYDYVLEIKGEGGDFKVVWPVVSDVKSHTFKMLSTQRNGLLDWVIGSLVFADDKSVNTRVVKELQNEDNVLKESSIINFLKTKASAEAKKKVVRFYQDCCKEGLSGRFTSLSEVNADNMLKTNASAKTAFINSMLDRIKDPIMVVDGGQVLIVFNFIDKRLHAATLYNDPQKGLSFTNYGSSNLIEDFVNHEMPQSDSYQNLLNVFGLKQ